MNKPEKPTILFVDTQSAEALSAKYKFSEIVPSLYSMICDLSLNASEFRSLMLRLISMNSLQFEQIHLMANVPLQNFTDQINELLQYDYPIEKIFIFSEDQKPPPSKLLENKVVIIPSFSFNIFGNFYIVSPPLNSFSDQVLSNQTKIMKYSSRIKSYYQFFNLTSPKVFSFGETSQQVSIKLLQDVSDQDALVLIDRKNFPFPIFYESECVLDHVPVHVLVREGNSIKVELECGTEVLLDNIKSRLQTDPSRWFSLSQKVKHSQSPLISSYCSKKRPLRNFYKTIRNGASVWDIADSLDVNDAFKLFWYSNYLIKAEKIRDFIQERNETKLDPKYVETVITQCKGENKDINSGRFIQFIRNLVESDAPFSMSYAAKKKTFSFFQGTQLFQKSDYQKIVIFILGGLSFFEIQALRQSWNPKLLHNNFIIVSDTLCSFVDPFSKDF